MEHIWKYIYSALKINQKDHPVLLTDSPLGPVRNKEKAAEIFFETFGVTSLVFCSQAALTLYTFGKDTGIILDCGDGICQSVPIFQGYRINNAIQRNDLGGRLIN